MDSSRVLGHVSEKKMNVRERFIATLTGKPIDRPPFIKVLGSGSEIVRAWEKQCPGLSGSFDQLLMFEGGSCGWRQAAVNVGISGRPANSSLTCADCIPNGACSRGRGSFETDNGPTCQYAVSSRDDWNRLRDMNMPADDPARFPADWPFDVQRYSQRSYPLALVGGGVLRAARRLLGDERVLQLIEDDRSLLEDIINTQVETMLGVWSKMALGVQFDLIDCWDDFHFTDTGPAPDDFFRRTVVPSYARISDFARRNNIEVVLAGWHGKAEPIITLLQDAGVTALYPVETAAGNDVESIRAEHPSLGIVGGLDVRCLRGGQKAAASELDKAARMLAKGRYIPAFDCQPPPGVTWKSYREFMRSLQKLVLGA